MQNFIFWLMGDTLGKAAIDTWNWLWQNPDSTPPPTAKNSDDIALEQATQILAAISQRVIKIQAAVQRVKTGTKEMQRQYEVKAQKYQDLIATVSEYQREGKTIEARLTMVEAIGIERILPELKSRWEQSQERLVSINEFYAQEQAQLALLESELETMKNCRIMNISMGINQNEASIDARSLQEKFSNLLEEMESRSDEVQIASQLFSNSNCILNDPLNIADIDAKVQEISQIKSPPIGG
jgi:phage shock protein A